MHTFNTSHIFIVCNSMICTNIFNILAILYNDHNVLNYTDHLVYSPLNSYCIYIGITPLPVNNLFIAQQGKLIVYKHKLARIKSL